jgi:Pyruvate/2-oxoacid:ferredoxin oxidoreductase delta subunit
VHPSFLVINAGSCSITYAAFTIEVMQIDDKGRPRPRGQLETLEADDLILALGQDTDTAFLRKIPGVEFKDDGTVIVTQMMTDYPDLFAGGDMVPSEVHRYHLRRARQEGGAQHRRLPSGPELHQAAQAAEEGPGHRSTSCTWYYTGVEQRPQPHADIQRRCTRWCRARAGERSSVLPLSCGNCFECYGACPEDAIAKLGPSKRYQYIYELCTGCAICFEQCPCHSSA